MRSDQAKAVSTARAATDRNRETPRRLEICGSPLMKLAVGAALMLACGCTGIRDYINNGFKVGPNYERPPAPVAKSWIDADDVRIRTEADDLSGWWKVFNDPALDSLICLAYQQNLTLREASFRVLQARAQLGVAVGNLFPQTQAMTGS